MSPRAEVSLYQTPDMPLSLKDNTTGDYEMLAGNLASIGVGGIVAVASSLIWPEDFTFEATQAMNAPAGSRYARPVSPDGSDEKHAHDVKGAQADVRSVSSRDVPPTDVRLDESDLDPEGLQKAFKYAAWASAILVCSVTTLFGRCRD